MRILIEEHQYQATDDVMKVVSELGPTIGMGGKVSVGYVGYYYNTVIKDCVFILPKVLMDEDEMVFGNYTPESILYLEDKNNPLKEEERRFIYELAVWIYRAISVYKERHEDSKIVLNERISEIGYGQRRQSNTYLDILLSIEQFNKDNQDFFFFIIKNLHSGHNKINWTRTISHSQAYIQDGFPIYLNPINKRRSVNFDEELMIIFFSILNYIHKEYGFPFDTDCNYELISDHQFKSYLNGMGKARLQEIKYKYFSDKALELWGLCYAFFDEARQITINTNQKEYLLVKSFEIVFEDIIDELLGNKQDIPSELVEQIDGKRVDHMFRYRALTEASTDNIYYIGDSKYYKRNTPIGKEALYKQFTYARNVVQWNLDLFLDNNRKEEQRKEHQKGIRMLRDDKTEGYNIIPNFFISARQKDLKMHSEITWVDRKEKDFTSRQFNNRLFDRDTLLVAHYDVNFLYVVALYGRKNDGAKSLWRENVKKQFREEIQSWLNDDYDFYAMKARPGMDSIHYLKTHFQEVLGKTYTPYDNKEIMSLALDNKDPEGINDNLVEELRRYFYVESCKLGDNPEDAIAKAKEKDGPQKLSSDVMIDDYLLVGCYRSSLQRDWILQNGKYNIRLNMGKDTIDGAVKPSKEFMNVSHVLLYDEEATSIDHYYDIKEKDNPMPEVYGFEKLRELFYPFNIERYSKDSYDDRLMEEYGLRAYLVYDINTDPKFFFGESRVDLVKLLGDYINEEVPIGSPFVISMRDLLKYIISVH